MTTSRRTVAKVVRLPGLLAAREEKGRLPRQTMVTRRSTVSVRRGRTQAVTTRGGGVHGGDAAAGEALETVRRRVIHGRSSVALDPHVQRTLAGDWIVHGHQEHHGLALFPQDLVFRVTPRRRVLRSGDALQRVGRPSVIPSLRVEDAARLACEHVREGRRSMCRTPHPPRASFPAGAPRIEAAFPMNDRPTVLRVRAWRQPLQAHLVLFRSSRTLALAWLVSVPLEGEAEFTIAIMASGPRRGRLAYCAAEAASACTAEVLLFDGADPARVVVSFPRPPVDYPPGMRPAAAFADWMQGDRTIGNNVKLKLGNEDRSVRATPGAGGLELRTPRGSEDEKLVNAFFVCNFMHDFFSTIGFGEGDGNFQQKNVGAGGKGGDALIVNVVSSAQGSANMRAQNDGVPAELTLGRWKNPPPLPLGMPTALDVGVIIHEYAHGVSQRLVGGRLKKTALVEPQSLALGEAWSDYFAITILNHYRGTAPARYGFASYASGRAGGVRPFAYDAFSGHFGQLGKPPFDEQHGAGSVFAAALIALHEALLGLPQFDFPAATAWRLVVDSFRRVKANPTFLEARDALLGGLTALPSGDRQRVRAAIWTAFARFGMGRQASCASTSLKGTRVDFTA